MRGLVIVVIGVVFNHVLLFSLSSFSTIKIPCELLFIDGAT